jgi:nicotinamidase-related amidase
MTAQQKIVCPVSSRKKALILVDVQPQTLQGDQAQKTLNVIYNFLEATQYDAYVVAEYYADEDSMMFKQSGHLISREDAGSTDIKIIDSVNGKGKPQINLIKTTKSCFKSENSKEFLDFLTQHKIEELHMVGFDINDCVLATVYDANDLGYFSFVIEEASHNYGSNEVLKTAALEILHRQNLTNNSLKGFIDRVEIIF